MYYSQLSLWPPIELEQNALRWPQFYLLVDEAAYEFVRPPIENKMAPSAFFLFAFLTCVYFEKYF